MSKEKREVPVQKGTIISNPMTSKQMPFKEKVAEKVREMKETRHGQYTDLKTPKK
jgi:hypothetical protein